MVIAIFLSFRKMGSSWAGRPYHAAGRSKSSPLERKLVAAGLNSRQLDDLAILPIAPFRNGRYAQIKQGQMFRLRHWAWGVMMAGLKVGEETFNVEVEGPDGAPYLVLSNSLGTTLQMWDGQMPALTQRFRVIRYDSRGHGKSVAEDGPYSIEQLGRDVIGILDALGVKQSHFMGLSMGGMVGMWLLTHAADRIGKAVLCNTGAFMGSPDIWNARIKAARNAQMESLVPQTIDRWFTKEFQERSPEAVRRIAAMVRSTPPLGYASACAAIRDMDQREAIRSIVNPVLVIVGQHDPATPPSMGGLIAHSIKGARLIDLDAAHLSNIEAEAAFTRAVVTFLTAKDSNAVQSRLSAPEEAPAAGKPAKKAGRKAGKKAAKKAARKAAKAPAKKTAVKKAAKKSRAKSAAKNPAAKKSAKKAAKQPAKKAAKKAAKKVAKKAAKKAAKKPASKPAKKSAKKARR
jgi:3-oxoadipate enol-lactonase